MRKAFWRSLGAALLAAVSILDPGSLGLGLVAGANYGLDLLPVILVAWLAAVFMQNRLARAGAVLREWSPPRRRFLAAVLLVVGLSTTLGEISGGIQGLRLFTGLPAVWAGLLFPALVSLLLGQRRLRGVLLAIAGLLFALAVSFLGETLLAGVHPLLRPLGPEEGWLLTAFGLFGTTLQPTALYLREAVDREPGRVQRTATLLAFGFGLAVNLAVLSLADSLFAARGIGIRGWGQAALTLRPLLGAAAGRIFALALLLSGLSAAAVTGILSTLAGLAHLLGRPELLSRRLRVLLPPILGLPLLRAGNPLGLLVASQAVVGLGAPVLLWPLLAGIRSARESPASFPETRPRSGYPPEPDPGDAAAAAPDRPPAVGR